jgi:hypothetical protein
MRGRKGRGGEPDLGEGGPRRLLHAPPAAFPLPSARSGRKRKGGGVDEKSALGR